MPTWLYFGNPSPPFMINGELITTPGSQVRRVPPGVVELDIELWGAGGGGGASETVGFGSGGGGGGGYSANNAVAVNPGDIISFNVGLGGNGASIPPFVPSTNGGSTTWSTLVAGGGGRGLSADFEGLTGGSGGTSSGGDVNTNGSSGQDGFDGGSGNGGNAANPDGGSGGLAGSFNGSPGNPPGGGGGGGYFEPSSGGNGANGGIRFSWAGELLDSFETFSGGVPVGGPKGLNWSANGTISQDTIGVTQGSFSCKAERLSSSQGCGLTGVGFGVDISMFSTIEIDLDITQMPTEKAVALQLRNANFAAYGVVTPTGFTGTTTLSLNIADAVANGVDVTNCQINIFAHNAGTGNTTFYMDYLRGIY